jgi:hypothetical protein
MQCIRKGAKPCLRQEGAKNLFLNQKIRHGGLVRVLFSAYICVKKTITCSTRSWGSGAIYPHTHPWASPMAMHS